ncbi:integrase [Aequitasia blattaphilus]|uniref:Tyrosine-type recombinase/integrase n=1 Tax=Aequitasia blattaphilus TaxID=2949332 RepID=A0ABT1E845_9FIRM|nr:tyrosine-type recombinase/integrase [Aequitasia blattaphilus]MCP1101958.1 tyrosine-type recombinase/integrase [Aequitasia blattaphilus]MCR8614598.1 tyrosine-type recombinase/integrase [Aequitasia blattaphilus]
MSIQKKKRKSNGKTVTYYYPVISLYAITGEKKYKWGNAYLRHGDAVKEEARMKLEISKDSLQLKEKENTLFKIGKELWLKTRITKDKSTQERDTNYANIYLGILDDYSFKELTPEVIQDWVTFLTERYAAATVNDAFNLLSQVFEYCIEPLRVISKNPCKANIQRPTRKSKGVESDKYWTEEALMFFMNHPLTKQDHYYNLYRIHATFGMRPGEICGISIRDVLLKNKLLTLNYGLDHKKRKTDLKNSGAQRSLRLPDKVIPLLETQIKLSNSLRSSSDEYQYLFVDEHGECISTSNYRNHLRRLIARINKAEEKKGNTEERFFLNPITPYGFRHTFATLALIKKVHIKVVGEIMGDSVETIMRNYAHIVEKMSDTALDLMSDIIID